MIINYFLKLIYEKNHFVLLINGVKTTQQMRKFITTQVLLWFCFVMFSQNLLTLNSEYSFFKGTNNPEFDDSLWETGNSPFHFGDGEGGTVLGDMQNNYSTFYLRKEFEIVLLVGVDKINIYINYDDGFRIWINGEKVIQINAPDNGDFNSFATGSHESGIIELFEFDPAALNLKEGANVVAIQCFNLNLASSDIYFDMAIEKVLNMPVMPRALAPSLSQNGGFFNKSFTVVVTAQNVDDTLKYTLDCSDPQNSTTAILAVSPVYVQINPENLTNRPNTPAVVLRASALKRGLAPSFPVTATYIFLEKVKTQGYPGGIWPASSGKSQVFDYEMDPDVVNNSTYKSLIDTALLDIPTLSLVTDGKNLVDPTNGIYVNAAIRGNEWERPASFELIESDGKSGFQVNAGVRIRGGWSRHPNNPKHAFRLFFREEYGNSKLVYPLLGEEGTGEFDKIDLRTSQNYSWSYKGSQYNTMNRDVFSRDLQREMGQPYTRSRYYHLYLNVVYWGLYQTQERADAIFAETYLG